MTQKRPSRLTVAVISAVALVAVSGVLWSVSQGDAADRARDNGAAQRASDDASARWESKEPGAYAFGYAYCSGMCAGCELWVTVRNGEVTQAAARNGQCSSSDSEQAPSIEDIFTMEELDRSDGATDSFEIHYDPFWGFPASVDIRCPEGTVDCGKGYQVTDFEVLP